MVEGNVTPIESEGSTSQQHAMQVKVSMQQGEHTGQPIYSNFTSVQIGQGVVIVDFGFLDPQTIHAVNRLARSGEKIPETVGARMSCRMAISVEAANQLAQQLNQLLNKATTSTPPSQEKIADQVSHASSNTTPANEENNAVESNTSGGFRFPWSKKTH
ncbi:hypothetical protein SAMN06296273_1923 [Nitrosomonas ureae]|uniref:Uncharacterized protein n=1 Tax=Nitrosomonas ureae TaxID=44577 RepID=A0A285BYR6_9PROT|nr:hypothetical protein [Nitrosomonas ureae]SNX60457.1 hypothetical protein SAMN06296273_1923 [Nitrosomonas ureae]